MSTVAQLDIASVSVEAGARATLPLNVTNTGEVVEDYLVEIIGVPAAWTTVDPPRFTLYPGTAQVATVDVHPPRTSDVPAGVLRMGVHVVPTEHPDQAVVPEAVVEILPFLETTAELVPHTSHGRFGARHQVAIDNRGNVPVTVLLMPVAGSDALRVTADPRTLTVGPGHAAFGNVRAKPVKRLWRGMPRTLPFALTVAPQGSTDVQLDAAHVQEPLLPPWILKALLALLALLMLLVALWFLVLRPTIASAAKEAVAEPVQVAKAEASAAKQAAAQAQQGQSEAAGSAAAAKKAADTTVGAPPQKPPATVTAPFSGRLRVDQIAGRQGSDIYTIKAKQSLSVTDFVIENTQGDSGVLRVTLNGQTLFTQALESFRTTDYHFVTPFVAEAGSKLGLTVRCNRAGTPPDTTPKPDRCRNAMTFGGQAHQTDAVRTSLALEVRCRGRLSAVPRFEPFRALRYAAPTDLEAVTAPPYDVLSEQDVTDLAARDPRNIVHVDVPRGAADRYDVAGLLLRRWVQDGLLVRDPEPSFTLYRRRFTDATGTHRDLVGVLGALEVVDEGAGGVLPHERTTPKASTDRLDVTRACNANLSPVWGLSSAAGLSAVLAEPGEPMGSVVAEGVEHVVERVTDPGRVADIARVVGGRDVLIADGHHRYAVARTYRDEVRAEAATVAATDSPAELTLAFVGELVADQLSIEAIHRLYNEIGYVDLRRVLSQFFKITPGGANDAVRPGTLGRMQDDGRLVLVGRDGWEWLTARAGAFDGIRALDGAWLEQATKGTTAQVSYQHGLAHAVAAVTCGEATAAVLIRPVSITEIERTAGEGLLMPPKSTYFTPKLRTGLVVRDLRRPR